MIRFLFIALLLIFRFFLSNSQSLKKEQKITIDQFINKLNNSDTTIDNYLIDYNELSQYFIHKDCYFSKYVLEKIYNDRKFLKTFDKCVWECRFSGKTRSVLSSEDKRWIHEMDSIKVSQVQEKMIKKNYKFDKDNPYQAIFDYNVSLLLVTDTCRWRQFIESIICDDELLGDADYIISFFNLPSSYKWIVGRFKKYQANNQNNREKDIGENTVIGVIMTGKQ